MLKEECGQWVKGLMSENKLHEFYVSTMFRALRKEILKEAKYKCVLCKQRGKLTVANTVHHVKHVRDYPELALSRTYVENGKEVLNLLAVCKTCHETVCHPERMNGTEPSEPLTEERW